jgi:hypothetical protein
MQAIGRSGKLGSPAADHCIRAPQLAAAVMRPHADTAAQPHAQTHKLPAPLQSTCSCGTAGNCQLACVVYSVARLEAESKIAAAIRGGTLQVDRSA